MAPLSLFPGFAAKTVTKPSREWTCSGKTTGCFRALWSHKRVDVRPKNTSPKQVQQENKTQSRENKTLVVGRFKELLGVVYEARVFTDRGESRGLMPELAVVFVGFGC